MTSHQIKALNKNFCSCYYCWEAQRMNTAYFFTVDRMTVTDIAVTFSANHVVKHSKPGKKLDSFHYRVYHIEKLCIVDCLKEYLRRRSTKVQTDTKALFITYSKPFRAAAIDSMRRWVKDLFIETSILKEYTTEICRSAATSKASQLDVDINFKTGLLEKCQNIL